MRHVARTALIVASLAFGVMSSGCAVDIDDPYEENTAQAEFDLNETGVDIEEDQVVSQSFVVEEADQKMVTRKEEPGSDQKQSSMGGLTFVADPDPVSWSPSDTPPDDKERESPERD